MRIKALYLLLFLLFCESGLTQETSRPIVVGYHLSVPAALDRTDQSWTGFYGNIYQCVLNQMEADATFQSFPVRRMAKQLESGKIDIGVLLARTAERDKHSTFFGPLIEHPYILLTKTDKVISKNEDWSSWTLGTSYGTNFQYMLQNYTTAKIETSSSWDAITQMLHSDRIDGVVIAREIVEKNISPQLLKGLKRTELVNLPSMKIGLYVSNQSPYKIALFKSFEKSLTSCKKHFMLFSAKPL